MAGALCPVITLFLTGFLVGINYSKTKARIPTANMATAQSVTGAPHSTTTRAPPGPETCPEFSDYNKTVELFPPQFIHQLEDCVLISKEARDNLTNNALFPVLLYENLKNNSLLGLSSLFKYEHNATLKEIIQCVKQYTGKDFKKEEATTHFGFNGTQYLLFDYDHCSNSMRTKDCVEGVYFEKVKDPETKLHKDAFTSSFEIVASYCELSLRYDARGAGYNVLPSLSLVIGTALMMTKLAIFN